MSKKELNEGLDEKIEEIFTEEAEKAALDEEFDSFSLIMNSILKNDKKLSSTPVGKIIKENNGDNDARKYNKRYREKPQNSTVWSTAVKK